MSKLIFGGDCYFSAKTTLGFKVKDTLIFNLEFAYGYPQEIVDNKVCLYNNLPWKEWFQDIDIVVSLANNHICDNGLSAIEQTLSYLRKNKVKYFGAGKKIDNYNNPCILEKANQTVGLLGYSTFGVENPKSNYNVAIFSLERLQHDIQLCKEKKVDKVVVCLHWGIEESPAFSKEQQNIAHQIIEQGVEFVIGHHSHCIQPFEVYNGKYIFYSLGNFYFSNFKVRAFKSEKNPEGIIYRKKQLNWNKKGLLVSYNIPDNTINYINIIKFNSNKVNIVKSINKVNRVKFAKLVTFCRKLVLMFISNSFVDRKIIDIGYFKNEIQLLASKERKMKSKKILYGLIMQMCIFLFALSNVFFKLASNVMAVKGFLSLYCIVYMGAGVGVLGIYALFWQQVLKYFDLNVANAIKTIYLVWGSLFAIILFKEQYKINNFIGLLIIIIGIIYIILVEYRKSKGKY